jgi:hypothetical protein
VIYTLSEKKPSLAPIINRLKREGEAQFGLPEIPTI